MSPNNTFFFTGCSGWIAARMRCATSLRVRSNLLGFISQSSNRYRYSIIAEWVFMRRCSGCMWHEVLASPSLASVDLVISPYETIDFDFDYQLMFIWLVTFSQIQFGAALGAVVTAVSNSTDKVRFDFRFRLFYGKRLMIRKKMQCCLVRRNSFYWKMQVLYSLTFKITTLNFPSIYSCNESGWRHVWLCILHRQWRSECESISAIIALER